MSNALENAKVRWLKEANYDDLSVGESRLIGVEADGNMFVVNPGEGVSTGSVKGGVIVTKNLTGPSFKVVDSVAVMRVSSGDSNGIDAVDVSLFEGHADAEVSPLYGGAGVGFNLAGGSVSIFDFNLGAGLSTGAGIKDDSVQLKVAGTGVSLGRKISISVLDNSFGIDLVRTGNSISYVGKEMGNALEVNAKSLENLARETPGGMKKTLEDTAEMLSEAPSGIAKQFEDAGKLIKGLFD
jgi:hypothetical protein